MLGGTLQIDKSFETISKLHLIVLLPFNSFIHTKSVIQEATFVNWASNPCNKTHALNYISVATILTTISRSVLQQKCGREAGITLFSPSELNLRSCMHASDVKTLLTALQRRSFLYKFLLFEARSQNCEKRLLTSPSLPVCPHATTRLPLDRFL